MYGSCPCTPRRENAYNGRGAIFVKAMSFPLTPLQMTCLPIVRGLVADKPWLLPSWVFGIVTAESGWDPAVKAGDFATTGSIGLMQVERSTAIDRGFAGTDQTDPAVSLATGIADLMWIRGEFIKAWVDQKIYSPAMHPVISAYNVGAAGYLMGRRNDDYWIKVSAHRQRFLFIDS